MRIVFWLSGLVAALVGAAATAHADQQSCAEFRKTIIEMENSSVRPPGWAMLDSIVRSQYARDCVLSPRGKAAQECWFRIDGAPTGVKANCVAQGDCLCGDRPGDGAYAATLDIGSSYAMAT